MRARGLKQFYPSDWTRDTVAPHAGAWIETLYMQVIIGDGLVAPHAGAWIETSLYLIMVKPV